MEKKRLAASFDTFFLAHIEHLLLQAGIAVERRNLYAGGAAGELPVIDVMPEIWVEANAYDAAADILKQVIHDRENNDAPDWHCPDCGELIEGQFAQCWSCGHWLTDG